MADGHGRIAVQEQQRHRLPDDVTASDDDGVPAGNRNLLPIEQLDNPGRRACDESRPLLYQPTDVDRRQTVHVLLWRDRVEHSLLGPGTHRPGQRRLNKDAVVNIAAIEPFDERDGFGDRCRRRQAFEVRSKPDVRAGLELVANVDLRRRVVAHEHDAETRWASVLRCERRDLGPNLLLHRPGERLPIEHARGHARTPFSSALTLSVCPSTTSSSPGRMIASGAGLNSIAPPERLIPTTITPNF